MFPLIGEAASAQSLCDASCIYAHPAFVRKLAASYAYCALQILNRRIFSISPQLIVAGPQPRPSPKRLSMPPPPPAYTRPVCPPPRPHSPHPPHTHIFPSPLPFYLPPIATLSPGSPHLFRRDRECHNRHRFDARKAEKLSIFPNLVRVLAIRLVLA